MLFLLGEELVFVVDSMVILPRLRTLQICFKKAALFLFQGSVMVLNMSSKASSQECTSAEM